VAGTDARRAAPAGAPRAAGHLPRVRQAHRPSGLHHARGPCARPGPRRRRRPRAVHRPPRTGL
jgi:hypothetical protein